MAAANASQQPQCAAPQQAAPLARALEMPVPPPPPGPPPAYKQLACGAFVQEQNPPKPPASVRTDEAADKAAPIAAPPEGNAAPNDNNEGPDAKNAVPVGGKVDDPAHDDGSWTAVQSQA